MMNPPMRKLLILVAVWLSTACFFSSLDAAAKRHNSDTGTPLPADFAGSMKPYDFSNVETIPIWPDSLKPVYLAHIARHGARYISSPKKLEKLRKAIDACKSAGGLTKLGGQFELLLDSVASVSDGRWGSLSEEGYKEEQQIAKNLYSLVPDLLKNAKIDAISSYVPRVAMTMYEFCHQLAWISSDVRISTSEGKEYDPFLRCFEADPEFDAYRSSGEWKQLHDSIINAKVSPNPARRIFGDKSGLSDKKLCKLTMEMYDVLQSLAAFGMKPADNRFMSENEYKACWEADNVEHYLRNAITPYTGMAASATAPLLAKIIADADESLDGLRIERTLKSAGMYSDEITPEAYDANLYFGHAETLMPLLSLMGVEGCCYDSTDLANLSDEWKDYDIVPLGAHLDIIILETPSCQKMVALLLNGRFVPPLQGRPLVEDWETYREYLINLIK